MKTLLFLFSFLTLLSCGDQGVCKKSIHVKLKNLTGFDGCGWVLLKDDGKYLEVQNFDEFDFEFVEGKEYHVSYKSSDGGSICMVGEIIEVTCMSED
jgi:hypothetical protein